MTRATRERAGRLAEAVAAWLLRLHGFRILARRAATPVGEIDLVARRGDLVLFVEVKTRPTLALALEAVTPTQRLRIERAALWYLAQRRGLAGCRYRFDVVALAPGRLPVHVRDAWRPTA